MGTKVKRKRWEMQLSLSEFALSPTWIPRPISQADALLIGQLMYEAYLGTIDYGGETLEELIHTAQTTLSGKYGPLLTACSLLIEEDGQTLGASLVTHWTDRRVRAKRPLLTFLMVHPSARGKGMGTFLVKKSINALLEQGEKEVVLYVTVGNHAAQHIYQQVGFQVTEEFTTRRPRLLSRVKLRSGIDEEEAKGKEKQDDVSRRKERA